MIVMQITNGIKKAGGYRSLQRVSHGMEPNFVLPAIRIITRFARFGKVNVVPEKRKGEDQ